MPATTHINHTGNVLWKYKDTYVRLDRSIANLLDVLDKKVGLQNVLFCHLYRLYGHGNRRFDLQIPGGEFYLNRCAHLNEYVSDG